MGLRALHSFQRGRPGVRSGLRGCVLHVSGMPPGGLIVGVRVVLGVLLPVLRRGAVATALPERGSYVGVWDSSQQVLATQGAVYVRGHCLQEQRIVYTSALLASSGPSARAHDFP